MKKNVILAVARRDLRSWFGNPTGYVFIILFVVLAVAALLWPGEFFRNNRHVHAQSHVKRGDRDKEK